MEISKKWPPAPVLNPSLSDTPEKSKALHGLSFRCPPIPCCWDFKPSPSLMCLEKLIFYLFASPAWQKLGRPRKMTQWDCQWCWEHGERKHPKRCNFWGTEINKGNWNFLISPYVIKSSDAIGYVKATELHIYSTFLHRMYSSETQDLPGKSP